MSVGSVEPARTARADAAIILVGPMGAGKSTVGARLAELLGTPLVDTDNEIELATGRTIPDIFADGEARFRELEADVVVQVLSSGASLVSLGGGSVLSPRVRTALHGHHVIYLDIDPDIGYARVAGSDRPLLLAGDVSAAERYRQIHAARQEVYRSIATHIVDASVAAPELAADILAAVAAANSPGTSTGATSR